MGIRYYAFLPLILATAACSPGEDYTAPEIDLASSFADAQARTIGEVASQKWWVGFNDPILNDLIAKGLSQNLSIRSFLARVEEAQAAARATGLPSQISGSITASASRSGGSDVSTATSNSLSFDPEFLVDLFGGQMRAREEALARLQAAELDVGTARLAYISALVSTYIDLRYFQEALAIARQTVTNRRSTLSLVREQREAGASTNLDEAQAQAAVDEALVSIPSLEIGFYASAYAIATLISEPAQAIEARLERGAAQPLPRGEADIGIPADLLRNRPDIRAAEREYAAAVAAIGVSEAELYPSLTLGGIISVSDDRAWSFGPELSLPLLNRGALGAERDQAVASAKQAELAWRESVLNAVRDVQTARSNFVRLRRAAAVTRQSVTSYRRVVELSQSTFEIGTTTLFEVLENQRALDSASQSLASANRDLAASWAAVQVATGRGWSIPE